MSLVPYLSDMWFGCVQITSQNDTIVFLSTGSPVLVTIPHGRYWLHDGQNAAYEASYPSLYRQIMSSWPVGFLGPGALITGEAIQPTLSTNPLGGLRLFFGTTVDVTLSPGHASWTFPLAPLGMSIDDPADVDVVDGEYASPYSIGGNWRTHQRAQRKLADTRHEQYALGQLDQYRWRTDDLRVIRYTRMPAGMVRESRAGEFTQYATKANRGWRDNGDTFQTLWNDTLSRKHPAILVHNAGYAAPLTVPSEGVEVVYLDDQGQRDVFTACIELVRPTCELYDVQLTLLVTDSTYRHT